MAVTLPTMIALPINSPAIPASSPVKLPADMPSTRETPVIAAFLLST